MTRISRNPKYPMIMRNQSANIHPLIRYIPAPPRINGGADISMKWAKSRNLKWQCNLSPTGQPTQLSARHVARGRFWVQKPHRQLCIRIMPRPWQFRSVSRKPVKPQPGIGHFSSDVNPASLPTTSFSSLDSLDWPAPALLPSPMAIRSPGLAE